MTVATPAALLTRTFGSVMFVTLVGGVASASATSLSAATAATLAETSLDDGYVYEARKLGDRVHVIAQPQPFHLQPLGNVTVVEQDDGIVLVDAGGSRGSGERIVELVRRISPKPVTAVIITHWHGDHPLGASAIIKAWPKAQIISTEKTRDHLLGPGMKAFPRTADGAANQALQTQINDSVNRLKAATERPELLGDERAGFKTAARAVARYGRDMDGVQLLIPTRTFRDRLLLPDRAAPVEAMFLGRANTDGDAIVWLPTQRVLVTGDVIVSPVPFGFGSYPADWLHVLGRLKSFDFAYLIPGHGAVQTDRVYLDRLSALLNDVRTRVRALVGKGLVLEEVLAQIDLSDHLERFAGGSAWLKRWFSRYWIEPIATSAYKEAKGEPIEQSE